jgi:hypothetical protein
VAADRDKKAGRVEQWEGGEGCAMIGGEKRQKLPGQLLPLELRTMRRQGGFTSPLFLRSAWKQQPFSHELVLLRPLRAGIRC